MKGSGSAQLDEKVKSSKKKLRSPRSQSQCILRSSSLLTPESSVRAKTLPSAISICDFSQSNLNSNLHTHGVYIHMYECICM